MLHCRNDPFDWFWGLFEVGNLPTMKSQLSQLPLIVGSGRVIPDAPFFLVGVIDPQRLADCP